MRIITLVVCAAVGYLVGGIWGAAGLLLLWAGVLLVIKRFYTDGAAGTSRSAKLAGKSNFVNIDAVIDGLEDVARERKWSLDKRLEIARLACENPSASVDELERLHHRGDRAGSDDAAEADRAKREGQPPGCGSLT